MTGDRVRVRRAVAPADLDAAFALRTEVFGVEQGVPAEVERDDADLLPSTVHVVAELGGAVVGTGRLLVSAAEPGVVHVGRIAVRRAARGTGAGAAVMAALEAIALAEAGVGTPPRVRVELSAQEQVVGFYAALGYTIGAERHLEAGIWHREAVKVVGTGGV